MSNSSESKLAIYQRALENAITALLIKATPREGFVPSEHEVHATCARSLATARLHPDKRPRDPRDYAEALEGKANDA